MKTKIAIVGVGRWGIHFVRNFLNHPQTEIVAIADPNPTHLTNCRQQFSLDGSSITFASHWEAIRQHPNLEAVVIATPASTHYPLILDALRLGYHVLAEKPLTLDPSECAELTRLAHQQQCQLFIDHTYLFNPSVEQGKLWLKSGKLGQLRYGYASRTHIGPVRQDVDALWDLAIHDIAIFNEWLGEIPHQVQAQGHIWLQSQQINPALPHAVGLADLVWVTLTYPSGFKAYIHLCWVNPDKQRRLCVVGSQGSLIFDEMSPDSPLVWQSGWVESQAGKWIPTGLSRQVIPVEPQEPLKKVCDRFLETITTRIPCTRASGQRATELVQILHCLSLSLEQQGAVYSVNNDSG